LRVERVIAALLCVTFCPSQAHTPTRSNIAEVGMANSTHSQVAVLLEGGALDHSIAVRNLLPKPSARTDNKKHDDTKQDTLTGCGLS